MHLQTDKTKNCKCFLFRKARALVAYLLKALGPTYLIDPLCTTTTKRCAGQCNACRLHQNFLVELVRSSLERCLTCLEVGSEKIVFFVVTNGVLMRSGMV